MKQIVTVLVAGVLLLTLFIMSGTLTSAQGISDFAPISIYTLDNGSVEDSIEDPNLRTPAGTLYGNPASTADRFGNPNGALLFDGIDDYVQTNEGSNFKPLTFSVWFRADDISGEHSIVDSDVSGAYGHSLIIGYDDPGRTDDTPYDGSLDVQYHNGFWDTGVKIETGKWYHAFVTFGDEMRLYLGSQDQPMTLVAQQSYTGTEFDGSDFRFGRHNEGDPQWFKGAMDDIRFYDKALTPEEIAQVADAPAPTRTANVKCDSCGDVHINTPDGLVYDFQERGDFLLTQSNDGSVILQSRQERWDSYPERPVSVNTAIAMYVGGDKLEFYVKPERRFYVNDVLTDLPTGYLEFPAGGYIDFSGTGRSTDFTIIWPDGNTGARVILYGDYIDTGIARLGGSLAYEGVLGNLDGNPRNDIQIRGGDFITPPATLEQLKTFGDSWRLSDAESLFNDPLSGVDTAEAAGPLTINDLDPAEKAAAAATCQTAGVTDPLALHNCTYDVAVTGDESFVDSAKSLQEDIQDIPAEMFVAAAPEQGIPVAYPTLALEIGQQYAVADAVPGTFRYFELFAFPTETEGRATLLLCPEKAEGGLVAVPDLLTEEQALAQGLTATNEPCVRTEAASGEEAVAAIEATAEPEAQPEAPAEPEAQPEATAEPEGQPGEASGGLEAAGSGLCASAMVMPMLLGMIGGLGALNGRRRRQN